MQAALIKKSAFRGLLTLHFIGLALMIGATVANLAINRHAGQGTLQALAFGRDISGVVLRAVVLPGFLVIVATGVAMTLMRYGRRPPLWVLIKVALNVIALVTGANFVAPALVAARRWAQWSAEHNQLAPLFQKSATQAEFFGVIILGVFLLNIPVAIWKPVMRSRLVKRDPPEGWRERRPRFPLPSPRRRPGAPQIDPGFAGGDQSRINNSDRAETSVFEERTS